MGLVFGHPQRKLITTPRFPMKTIFRLFCLLALAGWAAVWSVSAQAPVGVGAQLYMGLTITGVVGQAYLIESATSLSPPDWTPLATLSLPRTPYLWMDTNSPATGRRFYRVGLSAFTPLVYIPAGTFTMGSPASEAERYPGETQHQVTLTRGFWMGKYEVTQGEYLAVMGSNPSYFRNGIDGSGNGGSGGVVTNELVHPVEQVSWADATDYCRKLTQKESAAGRIPEGWKYRLPTESEWEYGSRGGTTTAFSYGSALGSGMANFDERYEYDSSVGTIDNPDGDYLGLTTEVGSYAANVFGLYDMHGNVWEWCQDWYGPYPGTVTDPGGPATGSARMIRGGSLEYGGVFCRSAYRGYTYPTSRGSNFGFRVVLAPGQ